MIPTYIDISATLTRSLKLHQAPIAISFTETRPERIQAYDGNAPAGCRFWEEASARAFVTAPADHHLCAIGMYTHNLPSSTAQDEDLGDALKVFSDLGYLRAQDIPLVPKLQKQSKHVVYAPLSETPLTPEVVLLFVDASQTLILSEATQQLEAENPPAMGRPACAIVPQVVNTGRAALSLGCCGARAYLDVLTDVVALFAIPGLKLAAYTERIEALASANATLTHFHALRRRDVGAGKRPTVKESLAVLMASS